jgi:outer membrane protein
LILVGPRPETAPDSPAALKQPDLAQRHPFTFSTVMRATILRSFLLSLAVALSWAAVPASGQTETAAPETLTLEEALRIALANNLALSVDGYNQLVAREYQAIADSAFRPVLSASASDTFSERQSSSDLDGAARPTSKDASLRTSISQKVDTGATVTLSSSIGRNETNSGFSVSPTIYDADVSLNVRQPLLQGAGTAVNRADRQQATLGLRRSELTFRGQVLDIIQAVELGFYNLAFAQDQLAVRRSAVDAAQQFLQENEARREAGLATELDVMQARVGLANQQSNLVQAQQSVQDAADQLLAALGYRNMTGTPQPAGVVYEAPAPVNVGASYSLARENDPTLLDAETQLKQLELDALLARNSRRPQLDLGGTYAYTNLSDSLKAALGELPDRNGYNWQLGLTLTVPWGMKANRARARQAEYNVAQQRAHILQLEQDLLVRVRAAARAVQTSAESASIAELSTELSTQEYQLEKAKFEAGLSTSRLVVDAQQRRDEAHVSETQAKIEVKQNIARLSRLEGTSLQRHQLEVPAVESSPQSPPPENPTPAPAPAPTGEG